MSINNNQEKNYMHFANTTCDINALQVRGCQHVQNIRFEQMTIITLIINICFNINNNHNLCEEKLVTINTYHARGNVLTSVGYI